MCRPDRRPDFVKCRLPHLQLQRVQVFLRLPDRSLTGQRLFAHLPQASGGNLDPEGVRPLVPSQNVSLRLLDFDDDHWNQGILRCGQLSYSRMDFRWRGVDGNDLLVGLNGNLAIYSRAFRCELLRVLWHCRHQPEQEYQQSTSTKKIDHIDRKSTRLNSSHLGI